MRWKIGLAWLALILALTAGCKQQCFLTEGDLATYQNLGLPNLECKPQSICETTGVAYSPRPMTVDDPEAKPRYISLAECIAIALEQGNNGFQPFLQTATNLLNSSSGFAIGPPLSNETVVSFTGAGLSQSDNVRALALDPATVAAGIEAALSKFDAQWITSMSWNAIDQPIASALQTFQARGTGLNAINQTSANFQTSLLKPLPSGGVAGISFGTNYTLTNLPARVNPSYQPVLQFGFEQPLLQGFGVEINQIRATHPGVASILPGQSLVGGQTFPGLLTQNLSPTQEGILVTRLRFDQERAEFERQLNVLVLNVEAAYWALYSAYWSLYAYEQALLAGYEAWQITRKKYEAGAKDITAAELAQARGQYELFRSQRLTALGLVLERERILRTVLNLPASDCTRLIPSDEPTQALYNPDWCSALNEALALRPELIIAREQVKVAQLNVINQRNLLLPDLRAFAVYDINGIGTHIDGADSENAFRSLASNHFNDWSTGLRMTMPIGFRLAHAQTRIARLQLARAYAQLQAEELKVNRNLRDQYTLLFEAHKLIEVFRAQRIAYAEQLRVRTEQFAAGTRTLDIVLEAQRFWAQALVGEYSAISEYNQILAGFEYSKGTILRHNNIHIAEGPLPQCAQVRAADHVRERSKSCVLRQPALPAGCGACGPNGCGAGVPNLPADKPLSLPELFQNGSPIKREAEVLPSPKPVPDGKPGPTSAAPAPAGKVQTAAASTPAAAKAPIPAAQAPALAVPASGPQVTLPPSLPSAAPLPPTSGSFLSPTPPIPSTSGVGLGRP
ncbi:MAG TPA: TolC family protein [Gemmataceae bacterium]|nr:TolC family protein [Gemmataceae bacterium]